MRLYRFLAWLLPLLLLGAQCLALAHGLLHTNGAAGQASPALQAAHATADISADATAHAAAASSDTADAVFGHHHDAHACQLYAHWAGGDVASPSVLAQAWVVSDEPVHLADKHYRDWVAPFVAHFSARAPPWRV